MTKIINKKLEKKSQISEIEWFLSELFFFAPVNDFCILPFGHFRSFDAFVSKGSAPMESSKTWSAKVTCLGLLLSLGFVVSLIIGSKGCSVTPSLPLLLRVSLFTELLDFLVSSHLQKIEKSTINNNCFKNIIIKWPRSSKRWSLTPINLNLA